MNYGPSLLEKTKQTIQAIGLRPRRRRGQNFVVSEALLERMLQEAAIGADDRVLEIGGGLGTLTERLVEGGPRELTVVEKDRRLSEFLRKKFSGEPEVRVVEGDYLKVRLPSYDKCVSNPPFGISSRIVLKLAEEAPLLAVTTFERQYSKRLASRQGEADYGRLSVLLHFTYAVHEVAVFPNSAFFPMPSTEISLLKMVLKPDRLDVKDVCALERVTKELFRYRRKKVAKALRMSALEPEALSGSVLNSVLEKRVFELSPEDFLEIATVFRERHR